MDRQFGSRTRAGVLLGYSESDLSWDEPGRSGSISGKYIGLYSTSGFNSFHLDASLGVTGLENSAYRSIKTPTFTRAASADFSGIVWGGISRVATISSLATCGLALSLLLVINISTRTTLPSLVAVILVCGCRTAPSNP